MGIDAMRAETDEFLKQDDPEAYAALMQERAARQQEEAAPQQEPPQEEASPLEEEAEETAVPDNGMTFTTMMNGARFSLGELLPWKGCQFQVIAVRHGAVLLQCIGLSTSEVKRLRARLRLVH